MALVSLESIICPQIGVRSSIWQWNARHCDQNEHSSQNLHSRSTCTLTVSCYHDARLQYFTLLYLCQKLEPMLMTSLV